MTQKTVCIVGAGISGLSCAHELVQRGFKVNVYEASDAIGGKAKSEQTLSGYPSEHGFRIYSRYNNLYTIFSKLKIKENTTVMNNLVDVNFNLVFNNVNPITYFVKRSVFRPFTVLANIYQARKLFSINELLLLGKEMVLFPFRSKKYYQKCKNVDFATYLKKKDKKRSKAFMRYIGEWTHTAWGANPKKSAAYLTLDVLSKVHYRFMNIFKKDLLFPVMNGPSSQALFSHWHQLLKEQGVNFYFNQVLTNVNIDIASKNIQELIFKEKNQSNHITADYYVLALPVDKVATLLPNSVFPNLTELSEHTYRYNGVQLYLSGDHHILDGITRFEDSNWGLIACYQTDKLWPNTHFKPPVTAILSAIISNWEKPGIIHKKRVTECSPTEIIDEIVAQIATHRRLVLARNNVFDFSIDKSVKFSEDNSKIIDVEVKLYSTGSGMYDKQPEVTTAINTLFLAGDYINTDMHQGTMESACISGKLAANAIMKAAGCKEGFCDIYKMS